MPRPPLRAVMTIALGWVGLRVWLLWPGNQAEVAVAREVAQVVEQLPAFIVAPTNSTPPPPERHARRIRIRSATAPPGPPAATSAAVTPAAVDAAPQSVRQTFPPTSPPTAAAAFNSPQAAAPDRSRWSGWAYAFVRPGGGRTLAAGGQLGGSQIAARAAYRLNDRLSVAARAYAPLGNEGAEAAMGADMEIGPIHAIVERRIGIDRQGRDAWAAYMTTGMYRERGALIVDAYAQAGIVGARRRDGFVDVAARAGARLGDSGPIVGAGAWGAAQPGVARIDIGPHIAWAVPGIAIIARVEGRFRVVGKARPGSGVAFIIARNF